MEDIRALGEANRNGYLPSLQILDLSDNYEALPGQLALLLTHTWPVLQKLHLQWCNPTVEDIRALGEANGKGYLPSLQILDLSRNESISGQLTLLFTHTWPVLQELHLKWCDLTVEDIRALGEANSQGYLPSLQELPGLDENRNVSGQLAALLSGVWQSLQKLDLQNCKMTGEDIRALGEANMKGYLPSLQLVEGLTDSRNVSSRLAALLSSPWQSLLKLDCDLTVEDIRALGEANRKGYLPSLQILDLYDNEAVSGQLTLLVTHTWPVLQKLDLSFCGLTSADFGALLDACRQGSLPQLKKLRIVGNRISYDKISELREHIEEVKYY